MSLVPVAKDRSFGPELVLECRQAMSLASGDINGNGFTDLVIACRESYKNGECSWIYWGGNDGYSEARRTRIDSFRACDVTVCDFDGDGYSDIVICQCHTYESFTRDALLYRGNPEGVADKAIHFETQDARRVFPVCSPNEPNPNLFFVNHYSRKIFQVSPVIYYGSPDGPSADRCDYVPGFGAVEAVCADVNDDGLIDLCLLYTSDAADE